MKHHTQTVLASATSAALNSNVKNGGGTDDTAALPNFRSYVAPGSSHTIIADNAVYAPMGTQPSVATWLSGMLDHDGGSTWDAVACPDCLLPPVCR